MTSKLGPVFEYCERISKTFTDRKSFHHSNNKGAEFEAFLYTFCLACDFLYKRNLLPNVTADLLYSEFDIAIRQYGFLDCAKDPKAYFDNRRRDFDHDIYIHWLHPKAIQRKIIHAIYHGPLEVNLNYLDLMGPSEFNKVRRDVVDFSNTFEIVYKQIESDLPKIITE